jgi:hypothetical protein
MTFNTFVVDGFVDTWDDGVMMNEEDPDDMNVSINKYHESMVSDYLRQYVSPPSISGKQEFVVSWDNYVKAKLTREMTDKAINLEFTNPEDVQKDTRMRKW